MQKIIGLDIGSYSIKAVEIVNNFKSYEITNFYEKKVPHGTSDENNENIVPQCMEALFAENDIQADRIITAMPGQYVSSRILQFQFSDSQKIKAAILGEIEDSVPFNLEEMIIDHQVLGSINNKTAALVVMTKKKFMASFLELLQRVSIDPKLVDIDSLSFYNLSPYLEMEPGKIYSLLDIGHEKTSICMIQDGILKMFRSINLGGRYITEFLARDLEISFEEAEQRKHAVSRILIDGQTVPEGENQEDHQKVASAITMAFHPILKELSRSFYAFKSLEKSPIEKILISGGTAMIKNMDNYLKHYLEAPVALNILNTATGNPAIEEKSLLIPQGLAIALRAVTSIKRHSQINLRKGEFAYIQDYENLLKVAGKIFKMAAFLLLTLFGAYMVKSMSYKKQADKVAELYRQEFAETLSNKKEQQKYKAPSMAFSKVQRDAESMLQDSINSKKLAFDGFIHQNSGSPSLMALKEISEGIPADIKINLVEYNYRANADGTGKLILRIETDSFDTVVNFKSALEKIPSLKSVVEKSSDTKPGSDLKVAEIEVSYQGRGL